MTPPTTTTDTPAPDVRPIVRRRSTHATHANPEPGPLEAAMLRPWDQPPTTSRPVEVGDLILSGARLGGGR
jgi:hypothetical protein